MLLEAAKALCRRTVMSSKNVVLTAPRREREDVAVNDGAAAAIAAEDGAQVGAGGEAPAMAEVAAMGGMWTVMAADGAAAAAGGGSQALRDQGGGAPATGAATVEADADGEGSFGG